VKNAQIAGDSSSYASHPNNYFPSNESTIGFANPAGSNYRLLANSPYKGQATDGKDPGCDFDALEAAMKSPTTTAPDTTPTGVPSPTPTPEGITPFKGAPTVAPGKIEAEDFDKGGEGVSYHDRDAINNGGQYRADGVDIKATSAASNGLAVFNAIAGEWLTYTLNVSAAGNYNLSVSVASRLEGGTFHLEVDGVDVTGTLKVPATGGWHLFQQVGKTGVRLSPGAHVLRLVLDANGAEGIVADFDAISVSPPTSSPALASTSLATATILSSRADTTAERIAPLLTDIERAYTAFVAESKSFFSADRINNGLLAALYFTRAAYAIGAADGPSVKVQSRLQIAASYLKQVNDLMLGGDGGSNIVLADAGAHASLNVTTSPIIGLASTRSSASFAPTLAPASLGTILGDPNQSPLSTKTTSDAGTPDGKLSYELGGVSVTVGGRAAQVLSVSPSRISFVVPRDLPAGDAEVLVTLKEGYVSRGTVVISPLTPGIFTTNGNGTGEAVVLSSTNLITGPFGVNTLNAIGGDKQTRLTLLTTGLCNGLVNADTSNDILKAPGVLIPNLAESVAVQARTRDGRTFLLPVEYAGAAGGLPGLEQVNVRLSPELRGAGEIELIIIVGNERSNTATVFVK
jgi:uncharacterized protein (TIGR03437 family)